MRAPIPELLKFLSAYDRHIVELALAVRRKVLTEAAKAMEMIYDAYNAVAIGYSFTGRLKEGFCHIAVYSRHVNLGFNRGAELPDPEGVLQGSGRWVRHLTIHEEGPLRKPCVRPLLRQAMKNARRLAVANNVPTAERREKDLREETPAAAGLRESGRSAESSYFAHQDTNIAAVFCVWRLALPDR